LTEYLTEQEQVEAIKNWIKQYSLVIIASVVLTTVAISGWRYWQNRQSNLLTHASSVYDDMLTVRARNNPASILAQADKLFTHYPKTTYGQMAALMLARSALLKKNYPEAEKYFNGVLKHSNVDAISQITRIRLARLYLAEQKPQASLTLLETVDDKSFNGLTDEVKGDAYLAMKNNDMAKKMYQQALSELPNAEVIRPLLQMKYDNLVTTTS
jgi:predicted negative regulator of RcsB-dependent stress response